MQLSVYSSAGEVVDTVEVSDGLFGVPMNQALVHQVAVAHMANGRQGTASTKTRGNVSGGGAKPWRQKHTGRARQGSIRSPQWRGGGIVFGPHPRDFSQRIPKKMNRGAIRCVISQKVREEKLTLVDGFQLREAKTSAMAEVMANLNASTSTLVITREPQLDVVLAARNLPKVRTIPASQVNVLDFLKYDRVIMTLGAARRAEELWALTEVQDVGVGEGVTSQGDS